ncbi:chromate efflux transporter [Hoeflea poritis]|uniref:Chromate efflux transporter n=1 Tax=Hoeflea poritis TaxID=2993659 RepID=A0ABT4VHE8_9HYPH|nr:chromate efflux transporter [Hoeflea poritis]MDA4844139.1 chromate efflux transporter [Hoeflea poritis]
MTASEMPGSAAKAGASLADVTAAFARIGILSFGGPAAQIALMHRVLVEEKDWLTERQYLNALSFCMLLPGPEAMQLATYAGWRLHGVAGGLIAGLLFVLPGAAIMLALAVIYALVGDVPLVSALFLGIKAAVLVIVVEALLRVAKKALHLPRHWVIAALAFIGIFFLGLPFPLIILAAALYGFIAGSHEADDTEAMSGRVPTMGTLRTIVLWLAIWWLPLLAVGALSGEPILAELGRFFSKLAVVTFGGAYAVLAYMAQDVVDQYGWLSAGAMMDGLGLAETTPGPLILVTEFVGFLSAYGQGGLALGIAGAVVTLWATFAPCFLWIFAGAPYIDWIGAQPRLRGALEGITAAVVGVILNLSIWFALHVAFRQVTAERYGPVTLWQPELLSLDWRVIVLALLSGVLLLRLRWDILRVLAIAAIGGLVLSHV